MNLRTLLAVTTIIFSANMASADEKPAPNPTRGQSSETTLKQHSASIDKLRPKAPSKQIIVCGYDGSEFYLSFVIPEGQCTLSVTDCDGHFEYAEFDSNGLDIRIPNEEMHGDIQISLDTELGNSYSGNLITTCE